jgi:hypothetical protein
VPNFVDLRTKQGQMWLVLGKDQQKQKVVSFNHPLSSSKHLYLETKQMVMEYSLLVRSLKVLD